MTVLESAATFAPMRLLGLAPVDGQPAALWGVALLADLEDFTGLTNALTEEAGLDGGELVSRHLNEALAPVIDAIVGQDGDVVKFSGDGLLGVFVFGADPASQARRAAEAIAGIVVLGPRGTAHRFRIGIASGTLSLVLLGGDDAHFELVACGPAVLHAQELVTRAQPGTPGERIALDGMAAGSASRMPTREASAALLLPPYVRERVAGNLAAWLQEFRTLTIVFVAAQGDTAADQLQGAARRLQRIVQEHGGQVLRFGQDGAMLVSEAAFGLACDGVTAGPREALQAAAAIAAQIPGARAGIASGRVFMGFIGSAVRRQWTSLGAPVNLAARLAQHAKAREVLIDAVTWSVASEGFSGGRQQAMLKGLGNCGYWRLEGRSAGEPHANERLIGRQAEIQAISALFDDTLAPARALVVRGEAGIGKSRVRRWVSDELHSRGIRTWLPAATAERRARPYAGLSAALSALCGVEAGEDVDEALRLTAARALGDAGRAPLLGDALGVSLADTAQTRALEGAVRAENIREALVALFVERDLAEACALVVDDAHWLDSASWALLLRLRADCRRLRIVLFTRPMPGAEPAAFRALCARDTLVLDLEPLPASDIAAIVAARMFAQALPAPVAGWIIERARGNPFFAQELAAMLAAAGHLVVRDGAVERTPSAAELQALPPLATIEATLEQRIDTLHIADSIALKLASVIGPTFLVEALGELGQPKDDDGLREVMARLVRAGMVVPDGAGQFAFRHRYTQEAAYRMLPSDRRRDIHRQIATWLEHRHADRSEERAHELAHHWFTAQDRPRALHWIEIAGDRALRTGADREAAEHFRRALSIGDGQPPGRLAALHRQLARAMFGLGEIKGVEAAARRAVELVVGPLPKRPGHWALFAARAAVGRVMGLAGRVRAQSRPAPDLLEGARAAGLLAESAYFLNAPEMMVGSALLAVGLAERAANAAPVAAAYGMLGVAAGMGRLHGVARRYLDLARELSRAADDPYQLGVAWFYTGLYYGCIGDWDASEDAARRALELTERLGAHMQSGFEQTLIASNALYTSEYATARQLMHTVRTRAERSANVQQLGWSCNVVSVADLHQRRFAEAVALSEQSRQIFMAERDLVSLIIAEGVQCAALAHAGQLDEAVAGARRAMQLIAGARPTTWGQLEGFAGPCEVFAIAMARDASAVPALQPLAQKALAGLRMFAMIFPFGGARYQWIRGMYAIASGREASARRHLRGALACAQRFRMPFEELRASTLARSLVDGAEHDELSARAPALESQVATGMPIERVT